MLSTSYNFGVRESQPDPSPHALLLEPQKRIFETKVSCWPEVQLQRNSFDHILLMSAQSGVSHPSVALGAPTTEERSNQNYGCHRFTRESLLLAMCGNAPTCGAGTQSASSAVFTPLKSEQLSQKQCALNSNPANEVQRGPARWVISRNLSCTSIFLWGLHHQ